MTMVILILHMVYIIHCILVKPVFKLVGASMVQKLCMCTERLTKHVVGQRENHMRYVSYFLHMSRITLNHP